MPEQPDRIQFVADRGDARLRLDQVLVRRISEITRLSRNVVQAWIAGGAVAVDGRQMRRPSSPVRDGALVEVVLPASATRRVRPGAEPLPLDILHEDDDLIVVNKPPGIVVHPSYKQAEGTLLNAVLWRVRDRPGLQPGILTRLDRDTSGLVIVVLRPDVHAVMQRDAAAGRIRKHYLAVVKGMPEPPAGRIVLPLARDPADRRRMAVTPGGAASETLYETVSVTSAGADARSLVRCELVTGRTHQIRVHLSASGWPIVGDRVYGSADAAIPRQALHAWRVSFPHPTSRAAIAVDAPVPGDITQLLA